MLSTNYHQTDSGIWTKIDRLDFSYSDGDEIEDRLLQQLKDCADVSQASDDLQRLIVDWPSEYHFSPLRSNLLSSFRLDQFDNILEIGSGCGAISRQLGENCPNSNIIALEGSARRAEITNSRCRDLHNIQVCNDSFTYFDHANTIDLITMIGVLEYSPSFFPGDNPVLNALKHARNFLSDNGVLIIAIENQLGLKYFNGAAEDHNGVPFSGINDLYSPSTVQTFGRRALKQEIINAGFSHVELVYPFPDYKLPQLLLREEAFHSNEFDLSYLVGQYPSRDYALAGDKIFYEARVWNLLTKNRLIQDFSNSFLAFAFVGDNTLNDITGDWLAKSYSGRRKKHYLIETVFNQDLDNTGVDKNVSYPRDSDTSKKSTSLVHHVGKSEYVLGIPYTYTLLDHVSKTQTYEHFHDYLTPWVKFLRSQTLVFEPTNSENELLVPGMFYDCLPSNILINGQKDLCIIDQEWEHQHPLELGFIFFRGLYRELNENIDFFEQSDLFNDQTIFDVVKLLFQNFEIEFDKVIYGKYLDLEIDFQLEVVPYNTDREGLKHHIDKFFTQTRTQTSTVGDLLITGGIKRHTFLVWQKKMLDQALAEREEQITHLKNNISNLEKTISDRDLTLSSILGSSSWKLTIPLRIAGYIIKGDWGKAKRAITEVVS